MCGKCKKNEKKVVALLCLCCGRIEIEREVIEMNRFKKYCPNVWVAECEEEYQKGEIIQLENQYGKEVDCEVYNLILQEMKNFIIPL